jgi:Homing endonuclease associated repeat
VSKEEIIAQIHKCAKKLGHPPTLGELQRAAKVTPSAIRKNFGTYTRALGECGMKRHGSGHPVSAETLFTDWAGIVRKLNKIPTTSEYVLHSPYSITPLRKQFGSWKQAPLALLGFAEQHGLEAQWGDVLEKVRGYERDLRAQRQASPPPLSAPPEKCKWTILADRPTYGPSLVRAPLAHGPVNEAGVVFLFGTLAAQLGFVIMRIQTEFPDCEAMRRVDNDRWQKVRIEFEYESRNFLRHLHDDAECDLIVCWNHNWPDCPLEVVELKGIIA